MMRFFQSVRNSPRLWLFNTIVCTVMTGSMLRQSGECLKTPHAKLGIVSFELAFTTESASTMKTEWENLRCGENNALLQTAKSNISRDMFFLVAYTLLFCVCVVLVSKRNSIYTSFLVCAAILAGALDAIENVFMLQYLNGNEIHPLLFGIPAFLKFVILVSLFLYVLIALIVRLYQKVIRPVAG
jgi:hypothetical protein